MADQQVEPPPVQAPPISASPSASASASSASGKANVPASSRTPHSKPVGLLRSQLHTTDATLLRLNKLLGTPRGVSSTLFTAQYTLWLLAGLNSRLLSSSPSTSPSTAPLSISLHTLASQLSGVRTTLRLTGLIPLYAWLRSLLGTTTTTTTTTKGTGTATAEEQDTIIWFILLTQCLSYITFQALENIAHLHDKAVITLKRSGGSSKLWLWSCRAWLLGVSCDFARLAREAVLEARRQKSQKSRKSKEVLGGSVDGDKTDREAAAKRDEKWWNDLLKASCWFPVCLHFSLPGGVRGINTGTIGALGLLAEGRSFKALWDGTK